MKKLALTAVGVAIVLVGFMAILYCLPCNTNCCDERERCEMKEGGGKCSGEHKGCDKGDMKCSGKMEGCEKGDMKCSGKMDGCEGKEKCSVKEWKDAEGKCHKEVKVIVGGDGHGMDMMGGGECGMHGKMQMGEGGCDMKGKMQMGEGCSMMKMGGHGGCCCCCMMMMNHCGMGESDKSDSVHVKVRGKL